METKKFAWYSYGSVEDVIDVLRLGSPIKSPGTLVALALVKLAHESDIVDNDVRELLQRKVDRLVMDILADPAIDEGTKAAARVALSKHRYPVYGGYSLRQVRPGIWRLLKARVKWNKDDKELSIRRKIITQLESTGLGEAKMLAVEYLAQTIEQPPRSLEAAQEFKADLEASGLWDAHLSGVLPHVPTVAAHEGPGLDLCPACAEHTFIREASETGRVWSGHCPVCGFKRDEGDALESDLEAAFEEAVRRDD